MDGQPKVCSHTHTCPQALRCTTECKRAPWVAMRALLACSSLQLCNLMTSQTLPETCFSLISDRSLLRFPTRRPCKKHGVTHHCSCVHFHYTQRPCICVTLFVPLSHHLIVFGPVWSWHIPRSSPPPFSFNERRNTIISQARSAGLPVSTIRVSLRVAKARSPLASRRASHQRPYPQPHA